MNRIVLLTLACSSALVAAQTACRSYSCPLGAVCVELGAGKARCTAPRSSIKSGNCTKGHEEWKLCATCEPTCEKKKMSCVKKCQPGRCMCRPGFFRNTAGLCITSDDCDLAAAKVTRARRSIVAPQKSCGPNSTFKTCSSRCTSSCAEKEPRECIATCGPPKCECNPGYYTNKSGGCVDLFECDVEASLAITCASTDCASGFVCRMRNDKPKCEPAKSTCSSIVCNSSYRCKIVENAPRCVPRITCATMHCAGRCKETSTGPICTAHSSINTHFDAPTYPPRPLILPMPDPDLFG